MVFSDTSLLSSDELMLVLTRFTDAVTDAPPERQKVPAYHFDICTHQGERLGECTLRVGYIRRVYYGGHIGYEIDEAHRGHHYAEEACRILFRLARAHGMDHVYITCRPDNLPSRRTCERLGGELLETVELPQNNDMREHGLERVCIFRYDLTQDAPACQLRFLTLREWPELKGAAADWFHDKWGVPKEAYLACMDAYLSGETEYGWYLCLDGDRIVGGLGVIENDFHDRKDLSPNVCAVYTETDRRGLGIAGRLLDLAVEDLRGKGISPVYLVTDHTGFYERYGWEFFCMAQGDGEPEPTRLYIHR